MIRGKYNDRNSIILTKLNIIKGTKRQKNHDGKYNLTLLLASSECKLEYKSAPEEDPILLDNGLSVISEQLSES